MLPVRICILTSVAISLLSSCTQRTDIGERVERDSADKHASLNKHTDISRDKRGIEDGKQYNERGKDFDHKKFETHNADMSKSFMERNKQFSTSSWNGRKNADGYSKAADESGKNNTGYATEWADGHKSFSKKSADGYDQQSDIKDKQFDVYNNKDIENKREKTLRPQIITPDYDGSGGGLSVEDTRSRLGRDD